MDDLARAAGSALKGSGDEVVGALKNWWKSGGKNPAKIVEEVGEGLKQSNFIRTKLTREIEGKANQAHEGLLKIISERTSHLKDLQTKLERTIRKIAEYERAEEEIPLLFKKQKGEYERRIAEISANRDKLVKLFNLSEKSPTEALKLASSDVDLMNSVGDWRVLIGQVIRDNAAIAKAKSTKLGNSARFLEEYLAKKRMPGGEEELNVWLSNPNNFNKLQELMSISKVVKLIKEDVVSVPLRNKLLGFSLGDMAKRLGIGTAALGGGIGAVKLFNWFDGESKDTTAKSSGLLGILNSVQTSGPGLTVLNNAKKAAAKIKQLSDQLDDNVSADPEKVAKAYLAGIGQEVSNLSAALKEWNKVVQYAKDKDLANKAGRQLQEFIKNSQNNLRKLGKDLGVPLNIPSTATYTPPKGGEIEKIQQLLKGRGYDIRITGEVDDPTIAALESLEREFPAGRTGADISGSLVNRQARFINSYDNIVKALNMLEK